jgi:hypothetical protein
MTFPVRNPSFPTFNAPNWGGVDTSVLRGLWNPNAGAGAFPASVVPSVVASASVAGRAEHPPPGAPPADPGSTTTTVTNDPQGHWTSPDYQALIRGDPALIGIYGSLDASAASDERARSDAIKRAIVQFGAAPASWQSHYGDLDAAALAAAQANPFSITKELAHQRDTSNADLGAALAGRGMLQSGALTGGEQVIQRGYDKASADATQQLLDALGGYEGQYASGMQQLGLQRAQALADAASRVRSMYPTQWILDKPGGTVTSTVPNPGATPRRHRVPFRAVAHQAHSRASGRPRPRLRTRSRIRR